MSFHIRLLGPVELYVDGVLAPLGPAKRRAVLAALALDANQLVSLDRLIETVWAGAAPRSALANLRTHVAALRRLLGDRIAAVPGAYRLRVEGGEVDAHEFRQLTESGHAALGAGDAGTAVQHLTAALGLWRGDTVAEDLPRGTRLDAHLTSLDEHRLKGFEDLVEAKLALAEPGDVIPGLRQHLARHPLRERAWGQLMLALYRDGDLAAALHAFQDARGALREQLGVEPGPELVALQRAVLARDPALLRQPPRRRSLDTADIVGRAEELAEELAALAAEIRKAAGTRPKGPRYDGVRGQPGRRSVDGGRPRVQGPIRH